VSDELPVGWAFARLEEIVAKKKGKKPAVLRDSPAHGFVPYLDIHAIERNVVRQFAEVKSSKLAAKDDLFVVWDGARSGWVGGGITGAIGSTIMALTAQQVESCYLRHFIASQFQTLNNNTRGTGIPHVDPEVFWDLEVPLAPLAEQRRIVAKLETLLGKVDASQQRLAKIPVLLKRFRQSILAAACSGRLTADWRKDNPATESAAILLGKIRGLRHAAAQTKKEKAQIEEVFDEANLRIDEGDLGLNDVPGTWLSCRVGVIGTVCNGSTPSRKQPEFWGGSIPWISSGEVRNNRISQTRERITKAGYEGSSVRLLPRGTVVLAMIGEGKTRGQAAVLDIEATINQNIAAVILDHGLVSSSYLWRWFQLQYEATRKRGSGSGPQALNCQRVRELPFVLPPFSEQQEIVRRVEALFALADQLEARLTIAQRQVDALTPSLLARAFRGKLVPQDPSDEPAFLLLERIRGTNNLANNQMPRHRHRKRSGRIASLLHKARKRGADTSRVN
jgi:type I restriction enzyme S subunit